MPISRQARSTRRAIPPRLAIRILENMSPSACFHQDQELTDIHRLPLLHENPGDDAAALGFMHVEVFHRLNDADIRGFIHLRTDVYIRLSALRWGGVEVADHGAFDLEEARLLVTGGC